MKTKITLLFLLFSIAIYSQEKNYTITLNSGSIETVKDAEVINNFVKFNRADGSSGFYNMKDVKYIKDLSIKNDQFRYVNKIMLKELIFLLENKPANVLYIKSLNWIKKNYINPNEVIKTTIENELIRFEGIKVNATSTMSLVRMYYNVKYTISLHFKDNKYKFEIDNIDYSLLQNDNSNTNLMNLDFCFKKSGELKSAYQTVPSDIENMINDLNNSLYDYITKENNKNDW